jgi:hypothetical protein
MTMPKGFPQLSPGEFAVVQADHTTGILLNSQGEWATDGAYYKIFPSRVEAEAYARRRLEAAPESEWWILDNSGGTVASFMNSEFWSAKLLEQNRQGTGRNFFSNLTKWFRKS